MKRIYLLLLSLFYLTSIFSVDYLSDGSGYIDVYYEKLETGGYSFYGDNRHFIPQFVNLGFSTLSNLSMDRSNPSQNVLKPHSKKVLLCTLTPIDLNKSFSFRSRYSYANGDPFNVSPDDYIYIFPFEHGAKFKLDQGFGGKFSHRNENFYALDFSMDVGTPVFAARGGVVIEVKEDSNRGGSSAKYAKYGNYIQIYHSDGTFASYVHLKQNGAEVEVGQKVEVGQFIGYSGNTGLSTGPHLHFSVNIPEIDGFWQSIAIKMMDTNGNGIVPQVGEFYYSKHPGLEDFDVINGLDLKNSDFADHLVSIEESKTLEFRDENIDSTSIVFCRNGYNHTVSGEVKFQLQNSVTSFSPRIKVEIPPLSEIYVCLVRPKDRSKPFAFSYSISYRVLE